MYLDDNSVPRVPQLLCQDYLNSRSMIRHVKVHDRDVTSLNGRLLLARSDTNQIVPRSSRLFSRRNQVPRTNDCQECVSSDG